jgi:hypothetical protein
VTLTVNSVIFATSSAVCFAPNCEVGAGNNRRSEPQKDIKSLSTGQCTGSLSV